MLLSVLPALNKNSAWSIIYLSFPFSAGWILLVSTEVDDDSVSSVGQVGDIKKWAGGSSEQCRWSGPWQSAENTPTQKALKPCHLSSRALFSILYFLVLQLSKVLYGLLKKNPSFSWHEDTPTPGASTEMWVPWWRWVRRQGLYLQRLISPLSSRRVHKGWLPSSQAQIPGKQSFTYFTLH
jgi:hypothetical protein